ncbi:MAG: hypothetical protein NC299_11880 [Lachnospiraceae bacterium]|nr:hypothetical protein [Lachnospiraceae bacterium]
MTTREERHAREAKIAAAASEWAEKLAAAKPRFEGSEKQIAWASDIYDRVAPLVAQGIAEDSVRDEKNRIVQYLDGLCTQISARTSAHWWISYREAFRGDGAELACRFTERVSGAWERALAATARA